MNKAYAQIVTTVHESGMALNLSNGLAVAIQMINGRDDQLKAQDTHIANLEAAILRLPCFTRWQCGSTCDEVEAHPDWWMHREHTRCACCQAKDKLSE